MDDRSGQDTARQRWMVIQLLRVVGVAFVILGIAMTRGVFTFGGDDRVLGYVFIAIGLLDVFLVPRYLARKWRTPSE